MSDWFVLGNQDAIDIDCGTAGILVASYGKYAKLTITVRPVGSNRQITVNGQYKQRRVFDNREFYAQCFSKGVLERQLKDIVISNVSSGLGN